MDNKICKIKKRRQPRNDKAKTILVKHTVKHEENINKATEDTSRTYFFELLNLTIRESENRQKLFSERLTSFLSLCSLSLVCETALLTSFYLTYKSTWLIVITMIVMLVAILAQLVNGALTSSLLLDKAKTAPSPAILHEHVFDSEKGPRQENLTALSKLYDDIWVDRHDSLNTRFKKLDIHKTIYKWSVLCYTVAAVAATVLVLIVATLDAMH